MSSFLIPSSSSPVPETSHTPRPLPPTLRGALEILRSQGILIIEIGCGLSNWHGSFHFGSAYAYLVTDACIGDVCSLLHQLGFRQLPRLLPAFDAPDPVLVIYPRSVGPTVVDARLRYSEARSAYHPFVYDALLMYLRVLCRLHDAHDCLHLQIWILGLIECLKGREVLAPRKRPPSWREWIRSHKNPMSEKERARESHRRRDLLGEFDAVRWDPRRMWMRTAMEQLACYEFDFGDCTAKWWNARERTDRI